MIIETKDNWVIDTNKWSKNFYTKLEAEIHSKSLFNCHNCSDCSDFKTNPERIVSPNIGSRSDQTTFYWNKDHNQFVCGCFKGSLFEFEQKVKSVHNDNEHAIAYNKFINKIKIYCEITF